MQVEEKVLHLYGADISVFSDGSVWNHRGSRNKRRFGRTTDKGYKAISIKENDVLHTVFVHRLVALAFIPNPMNKPQINHINGDKTDNRPENLEWCTNLENIRHRHEVLHHRGWQHPVLCVETGKVYETVKGASEMTGAYRGNILRSIKNPSLRAGGYHWKEVV